MAGGDAAGGSRHLADLIDQYGEYLLGDFQRHYGLSLVAVLRDGSGYSPRQLLVLIGRLPIESAFKAQVQGGREYEGWDSLRYQVATLIDAVRELTYVTILATGPKKKPKPPDPSYRPRSSTRVSARKKPNLFSAIVSRHLARAKQSQGE